MHKLDGIAMVQVLCGAEHSMVKTASGQVCVGVCIVIMILSGVRVGEQRLGPVEAAVDQDMHTAKLVEGEQDWTQFQPVS